MTPSTHERGFILVSAMWLLILCGAIAAVLIARARTGAAAVSAAEGNYRETLQLYDAAEIVLADLLFNGPRSHWAVLPAQGIVAVDGANVRVSITSEAGRLDLNDGDLTIIAGALQGLGVGARQRVALIDGIARARADQHKIATWAEVEKILDRTGVVGAACLNEFFTIASGLQRPREVDLSPQLARALNVAVGLPSSLITPGTALRVDVGDGRRITEVLRLSGSAATPYLALSAPHLRCPA